MVARKWCFVPGCMSSTVKTPTKIFVSVPKQIIRKRKWFTAVKRDVKEVSTASTLYCCEDHFNLEEDMENYLEYKLSKVRARIKGDVVPHINTCQPDKPVDEKPPLTSERGTQTIIISELRSWEFSDSMVEFKTKHDATTQTRRHFRSKGSQVSFSALGKNKATSPVEFVSLQKSVTARKNFQSDSDDSSIDTDTLMADPDSDTEIASNSQQ